MQGYGWTTYDARTGGWQTVRDAELHIDLTTEFLKSDDGNSWSVGVSGEPRVDAPDGLATTVIFHTAIEEAGSDNTRSLECERKDTDAECSGDVPGLGAFKLSVAADVESRLVHDIAVNSLDVEEDKIWQAKGMSSSYKLADYVKADTIDAEQLFSKTKSSLAKATA